MHRNFQLMAIFLQCFVLFVHYFEMLLPMLYKKNFTELYPLLESHDG